MVGRIPNGLKSDVSTKKLQIRILPVQQSIIERSAIEHRKRDNANTLYRQRGTKLRKRIVCKGDKS